MIFLWSDTHFNHLAINEYCKRGYADVHEMNEALITRWNMTVGQKDIIYHLGDFGFKHPSCPPLKEHFSRLNGQKHLIVGNHDEKNPTVLKLPWASIEHLRTLRVPPVKAILCHYPLESWKGGHKGHLMLHGHCHGTLKRVLPHRFDVGCDVWVSPVEIDELARIAEKQLPFVPTDHHEPHREFEL